MSVFSERLNQLVEEKGIKPIDLARTIDTDRSTVSKYLNEHDKKDHSTRIVLAMAKALDVNPEWLYGETDIRKPFYEPSILDIFGQLSETRKKELTDYAKFLLNKELDKKELDKTGEDK